MKCQENGYHDGQAKYSGSYFNIGLKDDPYVGCASYCLDKMTRRKDSTNNAAIGAAVVRR